MSVAEAELTRKNGETHVMDGRRLELCEKYGLDAVGGFLPTNTPRKLPSPTFDGLEEIAFALPVLSGEEVKVALSKSEINESHSSVVDFVSSCDIPSLRRANVILGFILHVLIHRRKSSASELEMVPKVLAKPFSIVCERLGLPMVCCACTFDTWNWKKVEEQKGVEIFNVDLVTRISRDRSEVGFHVLPTLMHWNAASVVFEIIDIHKHFQDAEHLKAFLGRFQAMFEKFVEIFKNVGDVVDSASFDKYRPVLNGFYPDGIKMDFGDEVILNIAKGASAGQSAMFFLFDDILGVEHTGSALEFQTEMINYIPGKHRLLIQNLRSEIAKHGNFKDVKGVTKERERCMLAYRAFRSFHKNVAIHYLARTTDTGTGATSFKEMLSTSLNDTR